MWTELKTKINNIHDEKEENDSGRYEGFKREVTNKWGKLNGGKRGLTATLITIKHKEHDKKKPLVN